MAWINSGSARLYVYLAVIAAATMVWRGGEYVDNQLLTLAVKAAPRVEKNNEPMDSKNFYPVWVKQSVALPPLQVDAEVDVYFKKVEEPKVDPPRPPEPDYGAMFRESATVDGVSDDGVFVNGQFYKIGARIEELAVMPASGKAIIPVVESIASGRVIFRVGKAGVAFRFSDGAQ
ncbi:MAG: hypothetical protein D4S02_06000 [Rhodocyclaceae bacterium]|nr:MAG: hypothetical protein D4S02_06000 [Rhodocyclaceae bacterium]